MNGQNQQLSNVYFKTISIIFLALLMGQLLFAVVAFSITGSTTIVIDTKDVNLFIEIALVTGSFIASNVLYKQQLAAAIQQTDANSKLMRYQSALIIRCALLEGASLFGIVNYLSSANFLYLII